MKLDLSFITEKHFSEFSDPSLINYGNCYNWALYAKKYYPEAELVSSGHNKTYLDHAYVKINNLYYDSENPQGVKSIKKKWNHKFSIKMNISDFKTYWKHNGRFPVKYIRFKK